MKLYGSAGAAIRGLGSDLRWRGLVADVARWQGTSAPRPTLELIGSAVRMPIAPTREALALDVAPQLPWAEEHFLERVSGTPHNPPPSSERWPGNAGSPEHRADGLYAHTYPERFWPRSLLPDGVRFRTGDLSDVIELLRRDPTTRQAVLPVWFPEDTGAVEGQRVPCTIAYWFVLRGDHLHATYFIRSCDYFRHLRDDIYLAGRLVQWLIWQLKWDDDVRPGFLDFVVGSLHCWESERNLLPEKP